MKVLNPVQRERLQRFVEERGVPFDPAASYKSRSYWDIEDVAAAAGSSTDFFNTATSSLQAHLRGLHGCNLPERGKLPGNTELIVTELRVEFLEVITAAKLVDAVRFNSYGVLVEVRVGDEIVLDERPLSDVMARRGFQVQTMGEGSAAGVVNGVASLRDSLQLDVESAFVWPVNTLCYVRISHNAPAALSAVMSCKVQAYGLEITH